MASFRKSLKVDHVGCVSVIIGESDTKMGITKIMGIKIQAAQY